MKKQTRQNLKKKRSGITLIALVITIIVLLILAGISISMLSGNNSILQRATDAKTNTEKANEKEQIQMEVLGSLNKNGKLEIATVNSNIKSNINGVNTDETTEFPLTVTYTASGNSYIVDETGNVGKRANPGESGYVGGAYNLPYIPVGFNHTGDEDWNSGYTIIGAENSNNPGDEFVWVPCTLNEEDSELTQYERVSSWHSEDVTNESPAATSIINSIQKYGGFYIAKYEASVPLNSDGTKETRDHNTLNEDEIYLETDGSNKPTSQFGVGIWNNISYSECYTVAESMVNTTDGVKSELIIGECWDTTLQWITKTADAQYALNSENKGNYDESGDYNGNISTTGFYGINTNNIFDFGFDFTNNKTNNNQNSSNKNKNDNAQVIFDFFKNQENNSVPNNQKTDISKSSKTNISNITNSNINQNNIKKEIKEKENKNITKKEDTTFKKNNFSFNEYLNKDKNVDKFANLLNDFDFFKANNETKENKEIKNKINSNNSMSQSQNNKSNEIKYNINIQKESIINNNKNIKQEIIINNKEKIQEKNIEKKNENNNDKLKNNNINIKVSNETNTNTNKENSKDNKSNLNNKINESVKSNINKINKNPDLVSKTNFSSEINNNKYINQIKEKNDKNEINIEKTPKNITVKSINIAKTEKNEKNEQKLNEKIIENNSDTNKKINEIIKNEQNINNNKKELVNNIEINNKEIKIVNNNNIDNIKNNNNKEDLKDLNNDNQKKVENPIINKEEENKNIKINAIKQVSEHKEINIEKKINPDINKLINIEASNPSNDDNNKITSKNEIIIDKNDSDINQANPVDNIIKDNKENIIKNIENKNDKSNNYEKNKIDVIKEETFIEEKMSFKDISSEIKNNNENIDINKEMNIEEDTNEINQINLEEHKENNILKNIEENENLTQKEEIKNDNKNDNKNDEKENDITEENNKEIKEENNNSKNDNTQAGLHLKMINEGEEIGTLDVESDEEEDENE